MKDRMMLNVDEEEVRYEVNKLTDRILKEFIMDKK